MAALYRKLDVVGVRAVATSAVRDANNSAQFLSRASDAIGTRVEIISGREEARLIHLGVESVWPQPDKRVLILDIGGGSAEIIAAENGRLRDAYSRPLGAVRLREMFLRDDPAPPRDLHRMSEFIVEKLEPAVRKLRAGGYDRAIATAATASAVAAAVSRVKRDEVDRQRVTTPQVRQLYEKLSGLGLPARRKIAGIGPRRAEIIVPGVAVLLAFLREFKLPGFYYSRAGVRDGIIADLAARNVGAEVSRLSREQRAEVEVMCRKYGVPLPHGRKVADLAAMLFHALQPVHKLPAAAGKLVEAAAYLHDVGHFVSSVAHHKHSWYVVANSDMPGFTDRERLLVAALCRYHRKALPSPAHNAYEPLSVEEKRLLTMAIPIIRLADNLDRSHSQRVQSVDCKFRNGEVVLQVHSDGEIDLETWAAERAGETFRQIYDRTLSIAKAK
jgi:exopolyphosphatase/guanosine-5'-triphosphate,3'-diphosphate pyrophosphatase